MMIRAFAAALALCGVLPRPAAAVDLALVLLNDVSRSMDEVEYALVKDGYRAAFADPEVIAALVGNGDGVAVAYVEFSGKDAISQVLDWPVLTDAAPARAFGHAVPPAPGPTPGHHAPATETPAGRDGRW